MSFVHSRSAAFVALFCVVGLVSACGDDIDAKSCGDGLINLAETCDDGNAVSNDGCSDTCQIESCGDGIAQTNEACDDGGVNTADCNADCTAATCGDGIANAEAGEACDDGAESADCNADCTAVTCGDGIINVTAGEACEDGGADPDDGCSELCTVEIGWDCVGDPSVCAAICGDGLVLGTETCDDDEQVDGDGCSAACAIETGFDCAGEPSVCTAICGDGLILGAETCDDDETVDGDGCSAACAIETGFACAGEPSVCAPICGDGLIVGTEQCDDNGLVPARCDASCQLVFTVLDTEPNDDVANAQTITDGDIVVGEITANDFDIYELVLADDSFVLLEGYTTVDDDVANGNGNGHIPEVDCPLFGGTDPDVHLFDGTGDVTDTTTSLVSDDLDGTDFCPYIGPDRDPTFLVAGTYHVRFDGFTAASAVPQYALDVRVEAPVGQGGACDVALDFCDPNAGLSCDGATQTCLVPPPPAQDLSHWELFSTVAFDLSSTTLTFTPTGGTYGVLATAAAAYPDTPGTGISTEVLPLGDDDNLQRTIASFPFFGTTYTDAFFGSNGYITFGAGDSTRFESATAHFDLPRVSFMFDDMNPNDALSGAVTLDVFADRTALTFDGVVKFGTALQVSAQVQLFDTGVITITYLASDVTDGLVGVSSGSNDLNPPPETDFSAQVAAAPALGDLVINEVLADPAPGADANCDGAIDAVDDEFIELVNATGGPLDLTGVTISDAVQVRHTFGATILPAGRAIVVYGGGAPVCVGTEFELASTGSLGINNGGDTITLSTGDSVVLGTAPDSISTTRDPDVTGAFVDHDGAAGATTNFSPGFRNPGTPF